MPILKQSASSMKRLSRQKRRKIVLGLSACVMLICAGCTARQRAIPHPDAPNRIAHSITVDIVIRGVDGKDVVAESVWFPAGSYIALPHVVEGDQ